MRVEGESREKPFRNKKEREGFAYNRK